MKTSVIVTTIACLLGITGLAQAATIASPAIFGAFVQDKAQCLIGNTGTAAVSVTVRILDESGNVVAGGVPRTVQPGSAISVFTPISFRGRLRVFRDGWQRHEAARNLDLARRSRPQRLGTGEISGTAVRERDPLPGHLMVGLPRRIHPSISVRGPRTSGRREGQYVRDRPG